MDADSFFSRWSRRKSEANQEAREAQDAKTETSAAGKPADAQPPVAASAEADAPPPTLQDVGKLTYNDDLSPFFARQVDEIIRRAAMKKLFADPHFNIMDGLDVYIEDYNKFEPLTPEVISELNHAQALLNPIVEPKHKLMELLDLQPKEEQPPQQASEAQTNERTDEEPAAEEPKAKAKTKAPHSPDTTPDDDNVQGL